MEHNDSGHSRTQWWSSKNRQAGERKHISKILAERIKICTSAP